MPRTPFAPPAETAYFGAPTDQAQNEASFLSIRYLAIGGLLGAAYFAGGKLGLMLAPLNPSVSPVWPPTGIALAALLVLGYRFWPAVFIGAFLVNITTAGNVATSLGIAMGNTAEGLVGAYLVHRFAGGLFVFDRPRSIFRFVALAVIGSTMVSATIGVTTLSIAGLAPWSDYGQIWLTWWLGDAVGALVVPPVLVQLWIGAPQRRWGWPKLLEAAVLALGITLVGFLVFGPYSPPDATLKFLCVPFLLWAAFRFEKFGAALAVLLLATVSIWTHVHYALPLTTAMGQNPLLVLQAFIGVESAMTIAVAAVVSEHLRMEHALRQDRDELKEEVEITGQALAGAQEQIRLREAMLSRAEQIGHTGCFRWNAAEDRVLWSDELYRIYGRSRSEVDGSFAGFLSFVHPNDRAEVRAVIERALQERKSFRMRERIVRPGGEIRVLDSVGEVVLNASGQAVEVNGLCRDVTHEHHAEQELQDLAGKLINAQEEERSRIGRELHDHISQRLGLLAINVDQIRTDPLVQQIPAGKQMEDLGEQFSTLTKDIHRLSHRLHSSMLDYLGLVPALQRLCEEFSKRIGIPVEFAIDGAQTQIASEVSLCLFRIAEESLTNIAKHSGARSARVNLVSGPERIHLTIEDTGAGFDPKTLDGTGLGFISMRERLRLVQGTLHIHSSPAKGTRIEALVPLKILLLVEDNPGDASLIRRMIAELDEQFRVTHVTRLSQALERLRQEHVDIIVLDLNLPDSWGQESLARVRAAAPDVPVLVISGLSEPEAEKMALGSQKFILKDGMDKVLLAQAIHREIGRDSERLKVEDQEAGLRSEPFR